MATYAKARMISQNEEGKLTYELVEAPETHACSPSPVHDICDLFTNHCKNLTAANYMESIGKVYRDVRSYYLSKLTDVEGDDFLQGIPS